MARELIVDRWLRRCLLSVAILIGAVSLCQLLLPVRVQQLVLIWFQLSAPLLPLLFLGDEPVSYQLSSFSRYGAFPPEVDRQPLPRVATGICAVIYALAAIVQWYGVRDLMVTVALGGSGALWVVAITQDDPRRRFDRLTNRIGKGRCPDCGYDLRSELLRGCPECGWGRDGTGEG